MDIKNNYQKDDSQIKPDVLELYAIRYGKSYYSSETIFKDPKSVENRPFHWLFYLVRTGTRLFLVDTGFIQKDLAEAYSIDFIHPLSILAEIGVQPADVSDIILTHSHFDHIGGIGLYPQAKLHLFRKEYHRFLREPGVPALVEYLKNNQNLCLYDEDFKPDPHIDVHLVGGHTPGSAVVYLDRGMKKIVLTGDEAYLEDNINNNQPVGLCFNREANEKFIREIHENKMEFYTFHSVSVVPADRNWIRLD